jgi:putative Ca2+/H+ antiporter (TMEM165/GDT1 family)
MVLALISFYVGAVLAWRFKVFVLVPTIAVDVIVVAAVGVARGDYVWSIVLAMVLSTISLQLGYLAGAIAFARPSDSAQKSWKTVPSPH